MKVALLKGNRYNPWHLRPYLPLQDEYSFTSFRAISEIQRHMDLQDDGSIPFPVEDIYFDTESGNPLSKRGYQALERYAKREPRILPFAERLKRFDVLHTWELFADWSEQAAIAKERYGIPLVTMVWDNIVFNMENTPRRRAIKERVLRATDLFLVHTQRSRRTLILEGADPERIITFPAAADTDTFAPGLGVRSKFGWPDNELVILYVGWLIARKGVDVLLCALRELANDPTLRAVPFRLVLAGSPAHKPRIESIIARLGIQARVQFVGPLRYSEMPELFRCADIFVLPSIATPDWQEQFGMSLIEAMASGLPCVSTHSGAIPEVMGDAGVLCQPADFVSLHHALRDLLLNEARRTHLGKAARARAVEEFGLAPFTRTMRKAYRQVLSRD